MSVRFMYTSARIRGAVGGDLDIGVRAGIQHMTRTYIIVIQFP